MSYADLEEARAERTKKNEAKENGKKTKRGRKREIDGAEADATQHAAKIMRFAAVLETARASENVGVTHAIREVPEPWRAPVARIWQ